MGTEQDLSWHELVRRLQGDRASAGISALPRDEPAWLEASRRVRQGAQIVSLQLGLSGADAEDLAQSVMLDLQASKLLERLGDSSSPRSYLQVVLRNRARDLVRRKQREQDLVRERWPTPAIEEPLESDIHRAEALRAELRNLSTEDWDLVKLRFWEGLTIAEIARRRGEPYSRVAVRLFRLGKRLAARLGSGSGQKRPRQN